MIIGLSSITFRHLPLERFLEKSRELNFDYIDIAGIPGWAPHLDFPSMTDTDIKHLVETLRALNLSVSSFNVGGDIASPERSKESVKFIQSAVKVASKINVPIITVGVGFKNGVKDLSMRNIKDLIKFSEDYGVTFTVEIPHLSTLAEKWEDALFYLNEIPELLVTLDTSHLHISRGTIDDLRMFLDRIKHIHLRDAKDSNISYVPGEGEFDFARFFRLVKPKYSGVYALELEIHETSPDVIAEKVINSKAYIIRVFQQ